MNDVQVVCAWREAIATQDGQRTRGMRSLMHRDLLKSTANPGLEPSIGESLIIEPLETLFIEGGFDVVQAEGDLKVLCVCVKLWSAIRPPRGR